MSPFLKGLLAIIGGFAALLVVALLAISLMFDPNDYKGEVQQQVKANTGRELQLSGPLSLSLFPWLGVQAQQVSLSNAEGFSEARFASLETLDVRLRLLPLLSGNIEIGRILVDGLTLNLERRADGSNNWQDLGGESDASSQVAPRDDDEAGGAFDASKLSLAGIDIKNANIRFQDAGELTAVEGLNLSIGPIAENQPSELSLKVAVSVAEKLRAEIEASGNWQFSLAGPSLALDDFELQLALSGEAVPGGNQQLELGLDAHYDGGLKRASLSDGVLRFAGQAVAINGQVLDLDSRQQAKLDIQARELRLQAVAKALELALPEQAAQWPLLSLVVQAEALLAEDRLPEASVALGFGEMQLAADAALESLSKPAGKGTLQLKPLDLHGFLAKLGYGLAAGTSAGPTHLDVDWTLRPTSLELAKIKGALAGEALSGTLSVKDFSAPAIRSNLDLAALRVADWQPAASSGDAAASESKGEKGPGLNEVEVPMDWARDLNLTARAAIGQLNAYGVKFRDVLWTADARPGQPVRQTLKANAYGGQMNLSNQIDARGKEPKLGLDLSAKAVGLGDLLADGWGSRWISGQTELGMNLQSQGRTVGQMRGQANGGAEYRLTDGEVQKVSLLDVLRRASAALQGEKHDADSGTTSFQELYGKARLESGKLRVREFGGGSEWLKVAGDGFIDLLEGRYDLRLSPKLLDNERVRKDDRLSRLIGLAIPVDVTGPLARPKFKVDLEALAKEKAKSKLDEKKDELRNKLNDKLGDLLRDS